MPAKDKISKNPDEIKEKIKKEAFIIKRPREGVYAEIDFITGMRVLSADMNPATLYFISFNKLNSLSDSELLELRYKSKKIENFIDSIAEKLVNFRDEKDNGIIPVQMENYQGFFSKLEKDLLQEDIFSKRAINNAIKILKEDANDTFSADNENNPDEAIFIDNLLSSYDKFFNPKSIGINPEFLQPTEKNLTMRQIRSNLAFVFKAVDFWPWKTEQNCFETIGNRIRSLEKIKSESEYFEETDPEWERQCSESIHHSCILNRWRRWAQSLRILLNHAKLSRFTSIENTPHYFNVISITKVRGGRYKILRQARSMNNDKNLIR